MTYMEVIWKKKKEGEKKNNRIVTFRILYTLNDYATREKCPLLMDYVIVKVGIFTTLIRR